jgi:hypothetical protein
MADEIVEKTEVVEDKKPETVVTPEKKFTQEELNSTVQTRVKREKDAFASAQAQWTEKETEYTKQIETYEKVLQDFIKDQYDGLTDLEASALAKLPILDQIELLAKAKKDSKSNMPITPKPKGSVQVPNKKLNNFFGG